MAANGSNDFKEIVIDAAIAGGSAGIAIASATAIGVVRTDPVAFLYVTAVAFLVAFLASLRAARNRPAPVPPEVLP